MSEESRRLELENFEEIDTGRSEVHEQEVSYCPYCFKSNDVFEITEDWPWEEEETTTETCEHCKKDYSIGVSITHRHYSKPIED